MAFEPEFMRRRDAFEAERALVRTPEDWIRFKATWFDASRWPEKTSEQLAAESVNKRGPVRLAGRVWGYATWIYDLTPEARYEYFATLWTLGRAILFPEERHEAGGWAQECPYCEITTTEIGDERCPLCKRTLILVRCAT